MKTVQTNCRKCGAAMVMKQIGGYRGVVCPYCGGDTRLLAESDSVRIEEIRADVRREEMDMVRDDMDARKRVIHLLVIVLAILIGYSAISSGSRVRVPFSARELVGMDRFHAVAMLRDAGFSDVRMEPQADLWDGLLRNDRGNVGKVAAVSVDGDQTFRRNTVFPGRAKVRVWYHVYPGGE